MSLKRGWCPTLDRPMQSGDGLLVRVQPRRATLTPHQAHALAEAAARHGNGILELTQRGNLQLRGLRPDSIEPFAAAMHDAAIPSPGPLLPPPLLGEDPGIDPRTDALLAALEHAFATDPRLASLPAKFALALDGGGMLGRRPVAADLVAHADGRLEPAPHGDVAPPVGPWPHPQGTSSTDLIRGSRASANAGAEARPAELPSARDPRVKPVDDVGGGPSCSLFLGERVGVRARPSAPSCTPYGLAPPFAQFTAAMLHALANEAARHATTIRTTPWRALLLARTTGPVAIDPAWITDPADPRLLVTTCVGAPGCMRGTTPTRADAARLRPTQRTHLSGCIKGCAHPGRAPITLVARDGRYDLVHNGRPTDPPAETGLTLEQILPYA